MNEKIIVVDDEPDILIFLSRILEGEQYSVKTAPNGEQALRIFESGPCDLMITDMKMPGMSGIELLRSVKNTDENVEVIVLTGHASLENSIAAMRENGAFDYLTKPLDDYELLLTTVERALERRQLRIDNQTLLTRLKNSEERYRLLFKHAPAGIIEIDLKKGKFTNANDIVCELSGYSKEEIMSLGPLDLLADESIPLFCERLEKVVGGEAIDGMFEYKIKNRTGREIWVATNTRYFSENNEIVAATSVLHDITENKIAELRLKESEQRYRELFENGSDLLCFHDLEGNIIDTNLPFKKEYGWVASDLKDLNIRNMIPAYLRPEFDQYLARIIKKGTDAGYLKGLSKDGKTIVLEYNNTLVSSPEGPIGVHGAARDVTQRVRAERQLRRSEEKFKTLSEKAPLGIALIDEAGKYNYINPKFTEIFGYTLNDISSGMDWFSMAFPNRNDRKMVISKWISDLEAARIGEIRPHICAVRCKNDTEKSIHFRPVTLEDGVQIVFYEDITASIETQKQLQQTQKMEAIGTLAGGIAHDFNNLLSAILGYAELAHLDSEFGSALERRLNEIRKAGFRAKELVKQILAVARQSDNVKKTIGVGSIAVEVLKLIRSTIPSTIDIEDSIESGSVIMGDPTQIHQILMNLCTNAAQAMEDKGGILKVSVSDINLPQSIDGPIGDLKDGDYIKVEVSDTGTGMSQDVIQSIFEPYYTTKNPGEGTGLGLAMVHGIVKSHGGEIFVDSEIHRGTRFTVYFPITNKLGKAEGYKKETLPRGSERILFVDDEPAIVDMNRQILEKLGYSVSMQSSSLKALELFRNNPDEFDLVITDMTMPKLTGDNLARELMKIRPEIPVIVCTGYSKKISTDVAAQIGIRAICDKPISMEDLSKIVRKTLDGES